MRTFHHLPGSLACWVDEASCGEVSRRSRDRGWCDHWDFEEWCSRVVDGGFGSMEEPSNDETVRWECKMRNGRWEMGDENLGVDRTESASGNHQVQQMIAMVGKCK